MKKFSAFILLLSVICLSGCVQKDLIDIYVFADRFSHHSEDFKINTDELTSTQESGELIFPITFNNKYLVTVRVNEETSLLTSVSVVYMYEKKHSLSDKDFSAFIGLVDASTKAFTNSENTDDVITALSLNKKDNVIKNVHSHFQKDFYKVSVVSNEVGIYFSAETERR